MGQSAANAPARTRAMRLRTQLMLLYGLAAALVYVFSIWGIHNSVAARFEEFAEREEARRQTDFVRLIASFVSDDEPISERAVRGAMRRNFVREVRIYDSRGNLLLHTQGDERGRGAFRDPHSASLQEIPIKEYSVPLHMEDIDAEQNGAGRMEFTALVRRPEAFVERVFMDGVRSTLLIVSLASVFLLCAISWLVSRSIARPLESVSKAAARIASGELGARLESAGAAREITALAESFNSMADALQRKESMRTRMTSDIAHELRTPVSIVKAHLEGLRDGVIAADDSALASLLDETLRLEKIINDLRSIWELENAALPLQCVEIEAEPFLQRVVDRFRPLAEEKGMGISLACAEAGLRVLADSAALNRVFDNLLQNALKYGRKQGKIEVHAARVDRRVCMRVSDDGQGIAEEDLPKIFERFYRSDLARARKTGGAGLGLAIAREAVEACGGRIEAANRSEGTGCVFSVYLAAV